MRSDTCHYDVEKITGWRKLNGKRDSDYQVSWAPSLLRESHVPGDGVKCIKRSQCGDDFIVYWKDTWVTQQLLHCPRRLEKFHRKWERDR